MYQNITVSAANEGYNSVFSETEYRNKETGVSPLGPTPEQYKDSRIDLGDAFWFTGIYRANWNDGNINTAASRNAAYRSKERPNVAVLYPGDQGQQKSQMWYNAKLDLTKSFELEYLVYMEKNIFNSDPITGGVPDGMTFVMQNDPGGVNAKGGTGVGLGVYPYYSGHYSLIYNAIAVELDTSAQIKSTELDTQLSSLSEYLWPHMGMVSTRTPGVTGFDPKVSSPAAYENAKTHYSPFVVKNLTERESFFGEWVPVTVKWTPDADLENGTLEYSVQTSAVSKSVHSQKFNIYDFFQSNYEGDTPPEWDKKVYWGFTGSNNQTGNATGIMLTKLPQQPVITGDRSVQNTTKGETDYKTETVADVGDIVKYKVRVQNNKTTESDLALVNTQITESLGNNEYVDGSFSFTSPFTTDVPTPEIKNGEFTFTDSKYRYRQGEYFEYTYEVKITDKTSKFVNTTDVLTTYSEGLSLNDTTVYVNPKELTLTKSTDNNKPKVGDKVKITSDLKVIGGTLNIKNIKDSIPSGMSIVPNSTKIIKKSTSDGSIVGTTSINDSNWTNLNLNIDLSQNPIATLGGSDKKESISLEYEVQISEDLKGEKVTIPKATFTGSNSYAVDSDKKDYTVDSNTLDFNIKTDLIINFKMTDGNLINSSWINSSNTQFNQKNPVTIYYQTADSYNVASTIDDISKDLFKNKTLTEINREGVTSGNIPKEGNIINVTYTEKVKMTIKQVYTNTEDPIYQELDKSKPVDNTNSYDVIPGENIEDVVKKLIDSKKINLIPDGYETKDISDYTLYKNTNATTPVTPSNIAPSEDFTIVYSYNGMVKFKETTDLDFGDIQTDKDIKYSPLKNDTTDSNSISIIDTRNPNITTNTWDLKAQLEGNIKLTSDNNTTFLGTLIYKSDTTSVGEDLTNETFIKSKGDNNLISTVKLYDGKDKGMLLMQKSGNKKGKYEGIINWNLYEGP